MLNLSNTSEDAIERTTSRQAASTTHLLAKSCDLVEWPFDAFAGLTILDVSQNENFRGLSRLDELRNLRQLYANECGVASFTQFPKMERLELLSLNQNSLTSIADINGKFPGLTSLSVARNNIPDLHGVRQNLTLTFIDLTDNPIEKLG